MLTPEMMFEDVLDTVTGHILPAFALSWVDSGAVPGEDYYQAREELWEGRKELCDRFGLDEDDP